MLYWLLNMLPIAVQISRRDNFLEHFWEQHDPNFVYSQCPYCPSKCKRLRDLSRHIRKKHQSPTTKDHHAIAGMLSLRLIVYPPVSHHCPC